MTDVCNWNGFVQASSVYEIQGTEKLKAILANELALTILSNYLYKICHSKSKLHEQVR